MTAVDRWGRRPDSEAPPPRARRIVLMVWVLAGAAVVRYPAVSGGSWRLTLADWLLMAAIVAFLATAALSRRRSSDDGSDGDA